MPIYEIELSGPVLATEETSHWVRAANILEAATIFPNATSIREISPDSSDVVDSFFPSQEH